MRQQPSVVRGNLFNIQKYSLHDGSGIRTIVFFKGCPLRCIWCSNPESQEIIPELAYKKDSCIGCGACLDDPENTVMRRADDGTMCFTAPKRGSHLLHLADHCPSGALTRYGKLWEVEEVLNAVEQDSVFYARSGGGMTLSGGEPLMQPEFALGLLQKARERHLHVAMETSGHAPLEDALEVCAYLDELYYDIKLLDSKRHEQATGVGNGRILRNILAIHNTYPSLLVTIRTPVVPGINDNPEAIAAIAEFVAKNLPGASYELLEYHRFGEPKYGYLGRSIPACGKESAPGMFAKLGQIAADIMQSGKMDWKRRTS